MKNYTALAIIFVLTLATPTFAAPQEHKSNNGKANGHNKEVKVQEVAAVTPSITISTAPTTVTPSTTWKNHGEYVSSVAKTHPGGKVVSEAARSDIGKKQKPNPTPSVTATPSATPSVVPSTEPTVSVVPSTEPSTTPPITGALQTALLGNPLENVVAFFQNIGRFFQSLV